MKFTFSDGEKLCVYDNGQVSAFSSAYITRFRESALRAAKNREWKQKTDLMMSDEYYFNTEDETEIYASIHAVTPTSEQNKILYAFSVNGTSGLYYKYLDDKEKTEAHNITSNEVQFTSLYCTQNGEILGTVQTDSVCADIAVFSKKGGDYKSLTGGDSLDENPSFDGDGNVLFNSYAVGRDANNNFLTYLPSEIYRLNIEKMETELLVSDGKYSYIKPIADGNGNLYCIRKTDAEKTEGNPFLEILLIPVRIVQAIVGFVSAFVMCFAKKPMVSGQSARSIGNGGDAAKNGKTDGKKVFINNNLINVDKELKKNKKQEDFGFIPKNWTLVRLVKNENGNFDGCSEYELARGVADYALIEENGEKTLVYTNGKHIFEIKDFGDNGKKTKLLDVDFCLKVGALYPAAACADPFSEEKDDGLFDKITS